MVALVLAARLVAVEEKSVNLPSSLTACWVAIEGPLAAVPPVATEMSVEAGVQFVTTAFETDDWHELYR